MGRPSSYTPAVGAEICRRLAEGESLRAICQDEVMPSFQTVLSWRESAPGFLEQYARAREEQAHTLADDALDDAVREGDARLRFDARRWRASKLLPKFYGDRIQAEHSGPDGGALVINVVQRGKRGDGA